MYPPVMLRHNLRGRHVDWYSNATLDQTLDALKDPQYKNIVFIGHGSRTSYDAANGVLAVKNLNHLAEEIPIRDGHFAQHTCGGWREGTSLREFLYPTSDSGDVGFDRDVNVYENYALAWIGVIGS